MQIEEERAPTSIKLTALQQQTTANIIFSHLVKEAPMGVQDYSTLVNLVRDKLNHELGTDIDQHMELVNFLINQIAVQIPGCDERLFAVEVEEKDQTELRNQLAVILISAGEKGISKAEVMKKLGEFDKKQAEKMLKTLGIYVGKTWKMRPPISG